MRVTIDSEGRIEIPEALREELGLVPGDEVELRLCNGILEVRIDSDGERSSGHAHLEWEDGRLVVAAPPGTPPMTADEVDELIRQLREPPLSKYGFPREWDESPQP